MNENNFLVDMLLSSSMKTIVYNTLSKIKGKSICKTCYYNKEGVETFCKKYTKRKPCSVKNDGHCEFYFKVRRIEDANIK